MEWFVVQKVCRWVLCGKFYLSHDNMDENWIIMRYISLMFQSNLSKSRKPIIKFQTRIPNAKSTLKNLFTSNFDWRSVANLATYLYFSSFHSISAYFFSLLNCITLITRNWLITSVFLMQINNETISKWNYSAAVCNAWVN